MPEGGVQGAIRLNVMKHPRKKVAASGEMNAIGKKHKRPFSDSHSKKKNAYVVVKSNCSVQIEN